MVALGLWMACTRSGCTCCHLHCSKVFKMRERYHAHMTNGIMNGNQGDHVTFVWTWRRSMQRLRFFRTYRPFIQRHDADAVHRLHSGALRKRKIFIVVAGTISFSRSTCVILVARSSTCKTHNSIPRYDTNWLNQPQSRYLTSYRPQCVKQCLLSYSS